jgi:hypothetical protein
VTAWFFSLKKAASKQLLAFFLVIAGFFLGFR